MYIRQTSYIGTKSHNLNVPRLVLQLSRPNSLRPGVKSIMKMAMLQLNLSDQQLYCLQRCDLHYMFDGLYSFVYFNMDFIRMSIDWDGVTTGWAFKTVLQLKRDTHDTWHIHRQMFCEILCHNGTTKVKPLYTLNDVHEIARIFMKISSYIVYTALQRGNRRSLEMDK